MKAKFSYKDSNFIVRKETKGAWVTNVYCKNAE